MPEISPTLTQQITDLIANINTRDATFRDWISGTADGGPNSDGYYPLADAHGKTHSVPCPAKLADMATGPAAISVAAKDGAEAALATATAKAADATDAKTLAEASKVAAIAARDLAQSHRSHAATHEATARYWAEQAQSQGVDVSGMFGTITELAQQVAANTVAADVSADAAADSAALAAHFEPNNFDLKSDPIAANRITGTISFANLPSLPGTNAYFSTGGFANITTADQTAMKTGDYVTLSDGRRWQYKGTGSKTDQASYVFITDDTPDYNTLANLPTQFLPSPHSHSHTDINGFTWANLNAKPNVAIQHTDASFAALSANGWPVWTSGNFDPDGKASVAHSHAASDVTSGVFDAARIPDLAQSKITGLTAALSDKAALAHSHAWADITGKPNLAIQNEGVAFSDLSVRQGAGGYVNLAPGNADWTGYVQFFHANGNRAGYIGFANASGNQIRLAADAPNGGFSFSHRPDFNGAAPWDSLNLPGPATTNTVQQINARKVFKSDVGGTALTASYTNRPLEVQSLASADDALMSFHIPGVRANTFGLRANGDWAAAGQKLWHEGNLNPAAPSGLTVVGTPTVQQGLSLSFDGTGHAEIQSYASRNLLINRLGNGVGINRASVTGGYALDVGGKSLFAGAVDLVAGAMLPTGKLVQSRAGNYATRAATNIAQFRYAGPNLTGAIVFKSSSTTRFMMQRLHIEGYLYETGKDIDLSLGFYNYTPNAFYELTLNQRGTNRPRVRIAYDAAGNTCVILGDVTTIWQYPHLVISEALLSHTDSDTYLENWTSSAVTSLTGFTDVREVTDSGVSAGLTTKQVDIAGVRDLASQFTLVNGDGLGDTRASFRGTYALGVSRGGGGHFYLGATSAASPSLLFYRVDGAQVASLSPTGLFTASGGLSTPGNSEFTGNVTFAGPTTNNTNWWRSTGQTGWYNSTYAVGIYSVAAGSVRTYNNASFTAEGSLNTLTANIYQNNGANRVPVTTYSQSAPSGGVDGDVHIVW